MTQSEIQFTEAFLIFENLKQTYGLSSTQLVFDLPEDKQIEFQKEFQRLVYPRQRAFHAIIKTTNTDGKSVISRRTIEI
ncbi:hypothetical protein R1Y08_000088 [Escherichia coli]|jgi:hypothetical protein|uniref:Uncharacterized protein n=5 Tax=Tequatrovirus TaxID=10663 RepID=A0A0M7QAV5_9CAUD|nr:hypothetical protein AVU02_gp182 [Escherichia phage slur07]YP_010069880.1 hypothetical protein KMC09_gp048 [Escherichia phage vB_EcoM_G50]YP_010071253.1 hypothetical protein KMC14_gp051 [Escherichia phage vB_EcoM_KAW1E185]YP_010074254.1 hypothetical protein KMC25_gp062 [Escherichia phage teqhad]EFR8158756.1 hypothetical protein [Escherichia coli]EIO3778019.1 hypothetical protein [Shigella flexneri]QEG05898.1 hypothetical protein JK38_00048 [Shigella phage JK38]QHR63900.1 hypothetical prot